MNIEEFQKFVNSKTIKKLTSNEIKIMSLMGLAGEVGELIDENKKNIFYNKIANKSHIIEETGDILNYLLMYLNVMNISLSEIIDYNVEKISKRYHTNISKEEALERKDKQ